MVKYAINCALKHNAKKASALSYASFRLGNLTGSLYCQQLAEVFLYSQIEQFQDGSKTG